MWSVIFLKSCSFKYIFVLLFANSFLATSSFLCLIGAESGPPLYPQSRCGQVWDSGEERCRRLSSWSPAADFRPDSSASATTTAAADGQTQLYSAVLCQHHDFKDWYSCCYSSTFLHLLSSTPSLPTPPVFLCCPCDPGPHLECHNHHHPGLLHWLRDPKSQREHTDSGGAASTTGQRHYRKRTCADPAQDSSGTPLTCAAASSTPTSHSPGATEQHPAQQSPYPCAARGSPAGLNRKPSGCGFGTERHGPRRDRWGEC